MGSLPTELWLSVRDALIEGTTFAEFVCNTRGFAAEERAEALRIWLEQQVAGERLASFEGTKEELEIITDYAHGERTFLINQAWLTAYSVKGAVRVGDMFEEHGSVGVELVAHERERDAAECWMFKAPWRRGRGYACSICCNGDCGAVSV
jgi:hypothetical protein